MNWKMVPAYVGAFCIGAALAFTLPAPAQDWQKPARIAASAQKQPPKTNPDPFNPPPEAAPPVPIPTPNPAAPVISTPVTVNPTVTDREKTWSEILIPNILNLVLSALGLTLSPWMIALIRKGAMFFGNRLEARLREKLESMVDNGGAAAIAEGATSRSDFLSKVLGYVFMHGKETLQKLGTPVGSPEAHSGVQAIAERLLSRGRWGSVVFKEDEAKLKDGDRISRIEEMLADLAKRKEPIGS